MTNQKQILVVSNSSVKANPQQLISAQQREKSWLLKLASNLASKLNHVSVTQWVLLLIINVVAFGFIAFAYICARMI